MRVIVYTAILGGCDSLKPAPVLAGVECICFTDEFGGVALNSEDVRGEWTREINGWKVMEWPRSEWKLSDPRREAWALRAVPHKLFEDATTVWVDASFTVTDLSKLLRDSEGHDLSALTHHKRSTCYEEAAEVVRVGQAEPFYVAEQIAGYRCEGFAPSSLSISCIIVRRNNARVTEFNELWDAEIKKNAGDNTQLSIDYCAWKTGVGVHHLQGVRKDNPYAVHDHNDHKKRRKPYR